MADLSARLGGHATSTALLDGDVRLTYGELTDRVLRTAAGLRARGLTGGTRVALVASPTIDGVVSYFGIQAAGLLPVMFSPKSPPAEHRRRLDEVDPALIVLGSSDPDVSLPTDAKVARPHGTTAEDAEVLTGEPGEPVATGGDAPAVVLYTSGVAGLPKPVVLTYANLVRDERRSHRRAPAPAWTRPSWPSPVSRSLTCSASTAWSAPSSPPAATAC